MKRAIPYHAVLGLFCVAIWIVGAACGAALYAAVR